MASKKTTKLPKTKVDKALKVAFGLLDKYSLTTQDLKDMLYERIECENIQKIAVAVDPKAATLEELTPWIAQAEAIKAKLDEEGKQLFHDYDSDWCDREYFRTIAAFYLGFAAGVQMGGNRP
jgi:hypothetical protein